MIASLRANPLRTGQLVEVRSASEIAATLDRDGKLDGMPFMPEMARLCGRRFSVLHRADVTCVEGLGLRRLSSCVFLDELRCDGAAHDGCQRGCLMFWKEAWLKLVEETEPESAAPAGAARDLPLILPTRDGDRYVCQSTALAAATTPISRWDLRHLFTQWRDGEASAGRVLHIGKWIVTNRLRKLAGRRELGFLAGDKLKNGKGDLGLEAGDRVVVKTPAEIETTLDPGGRNTGLTFEPDMLALAGCRLKVAQPIRKMIHEETGKMVKLTSTVSLEGIVCSGAHAHNCPRANPLFWRESWLKRDDKEQAR